MSHATTDIERAYALAKERYWAAGIDTEQALARLPEFAISLHCWQGDDVVGFEGRGCALGGGLAVTGTYPGRARNADELRMDLETAASMIPGRKRVNLHAMYAEPCGAPVERDQLEPEHFRGWMDWAATQNMPLDFNPTFFAHPLARDGFTLSHGDSGVRRFWVDHGRACRRIGAAMGKRQESPCMTNVWIPDGFKDTPVDREAPRRRLLESLDTLFAEPLDPRHVLDSVESKLFGIGSESYVVGSHEFYLGYAITRGKWLCLDSGHFHPTETISDKITAVLPYVPGILLHVSRGVRWDSDHVVTASDELMAIAREVVRAEAGARIHLGLDYFDAGINRIAAWVIGARCLCRALLAALLEPRDALRDWECRGDYTSRLAWLEELKTLPAGAVWDMYCLRMNVPIGVDWLSRVRQYEQHVLSQRKES